MADEDLFNLDDFQEPEISDNNINESSSKPEPEPSNKNQIQEEPKEEEPKDLSTKENSDNKEKEIIRVEESNQNLEISKFNSKSKEKEKEIKPEEKEKENNSLNDSDNENSESSNESQENEENQEEESQINLDFKERHDKMQSWAIEDDLDISSFSQIKDPPIKFPFELDEFQKRSILRLENHENVLVCAHTSSGKTVVAEYGIALGKRNSKRVLYTSPIKALSNQKFREFKKKFGDVGILTGDVSINPEAQCLIMTTEILQSSLYKNSELLNQVEWVIFDEVHYINDNERGHVWEEILILLPKGIGIIMLSATVPNYMEFAQWVGDIKETKVYVQNTLKRVVPLRHVLFIDWDNVYVVKEKDKIYKDKLDQAFHALQDQTKKYGYYKKSKEEKKIERQYIDNILYYECYKLKDKKNKGKKNRNYQDYDNNQNKQIKITKIHHKIDEIIEYLNDKDLCPAVIFVFSIKRITEYAKMLSLKKLITRQEENQILDFYDQVVSSMPIEDQSIPQVQELREILISGIGVHHAGLLPIIKETIEILYSRGLIKVLFATTSFSIGLNMPTRTVVFTDLYKFNDTSKEILSSSEYLQMCGRAGRRGIDKNGNVYILLTELTNKNEKEDILYMLEGKGTEVASKFRICYKTLLSFYSRNIKDMNEFFRESFLESNLTQKIPEKIKEIEFQKFKKSKISKMSCTYCLKEKEKNNKENEDHKINIEKELENNQNIININSNININNNNKNKNKSLTIEDYPIADYYKNLLKYKQLSYDIFTNEKVYEKLNIKPGRILKVRKEPHYNHKRKNNKGKNIDEGIYVVLIQAYNRDYFGTLWCLVLNKINNKNSVKNKNPNDLITKRGKINKYSFSYEEFTTYDLIEAYEEPFKIKLPKKNDNNNIWHRDRNAYYYLIDQGILLYSLRELERISKKNDFQELHEEINFIPLNLKEIDNELDFQLKIEEREKIAQETKNNICLKCHNFTEHYKQYKKYKEICDKIEELEGELNPENLEHYKEFKTRQNILQDLEYVNEDNSLTLKGKAAREIGTTDCVLITELLTSDILNSLSDSEIIAFLSGFASNKNDIELEDPYIGKNFSKQVKKFTEIYEKLYEKEKSYGFEENKYNRRMTFEFSGAMKKWMEGKDFLEVLDATELEEGKLYNLIMRIFLMLEEISNFYSTLGNVGQSKKILEIKEKLMRGIMAMQSLYLQEKIDIDSIGIDENKFKKNKINNY